jgi:hypothetical protein
MLLYCLITLVIGYTYVKGYGDYKKIKKKLKKRVAFATPFNPTYKL